MNEGKEMELCVSHGGVPVLAIGETAARTAQEWSRESGGRMDVYAVAADDEESLPILFAAVQPVRFVLYDSGEVSLDVARKFVTSAGIGGTAIAIETAAQQEAGHTSGELGAGLLIRVKNERECTEALDALLRMVEPPQEDVSLDIADVMALFAGLDYACIATGTASGEQTVRDAVESALWKLRWKPSVLRGVLLDIAYKDDRTMREINETVEQTLSRMSEDCNMIFGARLVPALEEIVKVTIMATAS